MQHLNQIKASCSDYEDKWGSQLSVANATADKQTRLWSKLQTFFNNWISCKYSEIMQTPVQHAQNTTKSNRLKTTHRVLIKNLKLIQITSALHLPTKVITQHWMHLSTRSLCSINKQHTHTVSQKQDTKLLPITSANVNQFSKFFYWQTQW